MKRYKRMDYKELSAAYKRLAYLINRTNNKRIKKKLHSKGWDITITQFNRSKLVN